MKELTVRNLIVKVKNYDHENRVELIKRYPLLSTLPYCKLEQAAYEILTADKLESYLQEKQKNRINDDTIIDKTIGDDKFDDNEFVATEINEEVENEIIAQVKTAKNDEIETQEKKKRGRPKKETTEVVEVKTAKNDEIETQEKKKRGRPKKETTAIKAEVKAEVKTKIVEEENDDDFDFNFDFE